MDIEPTELEAWDDLLPSSGFEVFHTQSALEVLNSHVSGDMNLLVGYKGDRPVGLFPVFLQRNGLGTSVVSPPPCMGIPRLGPLVMPASPKQRKRERLNGRFIRAVLDEVNADNVRTLLRIKCSTSYTDPRAYTWEGLNVSTKFSYVIDTQSKSVNSLLETFNPDLRREIEGLDNSELLVSTSDIDEFRIAYQRIADLTNQNDLNYPWAYVMDLANALTKSDRCRVYIARTPDDEPVGGIVVLYSNEVAYYWLGTPRFQFNGFDVRTALHWQVLGDIIAGEPRESVSHYDLLEAETPVACRYKIRFGTHSTPYYVAESGGTPMSLAKKAYRVKQLIG